MKRINLNKQERYTFMLLVQGFESCPISYPLDIFTNSVRTLDRLGLVKAQYAEGGVVIGARLSALGKQYYAFNPKLHNPLNWTAITAVVSLLALIVSIFAIVVACR